MAKPELVTRHPSHVIDPECHGCGGRFPVVVEVGEEPNYECYNCQLCLGCLEAARALLVSTSAIPEK